MVLLLSLRVPAKLCLRPDMGDRLFDLAAGLELLAQGAQHLVDDLYLRLHVQPAPLLAVQVFPLLGQGVDLCLQGVPQHGKLLCAVHAVCLQKAELRRIAVQLRDLLSGAERHRGASGGGFADAQQVQVIDIQGAETC